MFPHPPAPHNERKPRLPLEDAEHPYDETAQRLLASAATGDESLLPRYRAGTDSLFLSAIDPATGDSALHRAAAAGNTAFMKLITPGFGKQLGQRPDQLRLLWVLITHQNLAGDTALHAAARAGSLRGVKAVYRLFNRADLEDDDPQRGPGSDNPHAEYWDWGPVEDDPQATLPALAFVCTKNRAGYDAAAEARAAGHEEVAVWLDALAERLDREGKRADEEYLRGARGLALKDHCYYDETDSDRREGQEQLIEPRSSARII